MDRIAFLAGLASAAIATVGAIKFLNQLLGFVMDGHLWVLPILAVSMFCAIFERYVWFAEKILGRTVQMPGSVERAFERLRRYWRAIAVLYTLILGAAIAGIAWPVSAMWALRSSCRPCENDDAFLIVMTAVVLIFVGLWSVLFMAVVVVPMLPTERATAWREFLRSHRFQFGAVSVALGFMVAAATFAWVSLLINRVLDTHHFDAIDLVILLVWAVTVAPVGAAVWKIHKSWRHSTPRPGSENTATITQSERRG